MDQLTIFDFVKLRTFLKKKLQGTRVKGRAQISGPRR